MIRSSCVILYIFYVCIDGNRNNDFAMNATSGELTLQNSLNPQNASDLVYDLVLQANDSQQAVTLNLTVNVKTGNMMYCLAHLEIVMYSLYSSVITETF